MKDTFILSTEDYELIQELTDAQAGILLKAIMRYQLQLEEPEMDKETTIVYKAIRRRVALFNERYEKTCQARREAGSKGGIAKANNAKANVANAKFAKTNVANVADTDTDTESDTDNNKAAAKKKTYRTKLHNFNQRNDDYNSIAAGIIANQ